MAHHAGVCAESSQQLGAGVGQPAQGTGRGRAGQRGEHRFQPVGDGAVVVAEQVMQLVQACAAGASLPLVEPFNGAALDAGLISSGWSERVAVRGCAAAGRVSAAAPLLVVC